MPPTSKGLARDKVCFATGRARNRAWYVGEPRDAHSDEHDARNPDNEWQHQPSALPHGGET